MKNLSKTIEKRIYPLVNVYKTMERPTRKSPISTGPFSTANCNELQKGKTIEKPLKAIKFNGFSNFQKEDHPTW
jgi:hypothetical protein